MKAELYGLHVIDDPVCVCSNHAENCEHFFFQCYLYTIQHVAFIARLMELYSVDITTNLLLFGSDDLNSDVANLLLFGSDELNSVVHCHIF